MDIYSMVIIIYSYRVVHLQNIMDSCFRENRVDIVFLFLKALDLMYKADLRGLCKVERRKNTKGTRGDNIEANWEGFVFGSCIMKLKKLATKKCQQMERKQKIPNRGLLSRDKGPERGSTIKEKLQTESTLLSQES